MASEEQSHTFVFADLAGFTALTEAHGDERATLSPPVGVGLFGSSLWASAGPTFGDGSSMPPSRKRGRMLRRTKQDPRKPLCVRCDRFLKLRSERSQLSRQ